MDTVEATKKLKFSENRIIKIQEKINSLTRSFEDKLLGDWTRKQRAELKKEYKNRATRYKGIIRENKRIISKCKKFLKPKKQVQVNTIIPLNMDVELPLIKESLLKTIKGLESTEKGTFTYNNIEYFIECVENKNKITGTEVVFKPVKVFDDSIVISANEDIEDYYPSICCTLHKGYYVVKHDGFNNVTYQMSDKEKREKRKLYNRFYYRNRTKVKRQEAKKNLKRTCLNCGKEFEVRNKKQKFCCKECAKSYTREQAKELRRIENAVKYKAICPICGKEFIKTKGCQIYCSDKCRIKRNNNRIIAKKRELLLSKVHKCRNCGKVFIPSSSKQVHCSPECRMKYDVKLRVMRDREKKISL